MLIPVILIFISTIQIVYKAYHNLKCLACLYASVNTTEFLRMSFCEYVFATVVCKTTASKTVVSDFYIWFFYIFSHVWNNFVI